MVGSGVDRRQLVDASWETFVNVGSKDATFSRSIQALEVCKLGRIKGSGLSKRIQFLNDDMRVSADDALVIQLLRSGEVVLRGIDKVTSFEIVDRHLDCEYLVCCDSAAVRRENKLGGWHLCLCRDRSHRCWVA